MKVYPWEGLIRSIKGKYGVFTDVKSQNSGFIWPFQENIFDDPYELGKSFGEFVYDFSERFHKIGIDPEHDLPTEGEEGIIIYFVKSGKVKSLDKKDFELFKKGIKEGYPDYKYI